MTDLNEQTRRELRELIGRTIYEAPDSRGTPRDPDEWDFGIGEGCRELYRCDGDRVIEALIKGVFSEMLAEIKEDHGGDKSAYGCRACALYNRLTKPDPMLYPSADGRAAIGAGPKETT